MTSQFFKNPRRQEAANKNYSELTVTEYNRRGIVPEDMSIGPSSKLLQSPKIIEKETTNQEQKTFAPIKIETTSQSIPNIGNNMEQSWSSIEDDAGLDQDHPMIDNNDRVDIKETYVPKLVSEAYYLVIVNDEVVFNGNLEDAESIIENLLMNENVQLEDVSVFKKVNIKAGIFISE